MPWEKSFDEDVIVDRAMQVFWEKGYNGSSITDLTDATQINRGSLYNAFGDKLNLFIRALTKYDKENRRAILTDLEALNSPRDAFRGLFDAIIEETIQDEQKRGCFLINTALDLPSHGDKVTEIVLKGLGELEAFFQRGIEVSQARKQIPQHVVPVTTAKALVALVVAIRVLGRGVFTESSLRAIANEAERLID
ncbi:TetR/AcrR family transcriptional regulator [Alteromonadaceae bacterium M269]|nr:TetR/AcrR family transcriptional regulator [Alteromonadaceae bacterium M269]